MAEAVIAECGADLSAFPSEKQFTSWLGLVPTNDQSSGKILNRRTRRVVNRAATVFPMPPRRYYEAKAIWARNIADCVLVCQEATKFPFRFSRSNRRNFSAPMSLTAAAAAPIHISSLISVS